MNLTEALDAYAGGYRAGYADRLLGLKNGYSSFVESAPTYSSNFARGYNAGYTSVDTAS